MARTSRSRTRRPAFLCLAISIRGTIHNDGFPTAKPAAAQLPAATDAAAHQDTFQTVLSAMNDIGAEQPIDVQLEFETSTRDLGDGRANFALDGRHLTWRSAPVDEFPFTAASTTASSS